MDPQSIATLLPTALAGGLYVVIHAAFVGTLLARRAPAGGRPAGKVSILKPLAGADDDLDDNLESFAHLEGHDYELLFGLASMSDPAAPVVRAFLARHPELDARIVWTDPGDAINPKVAQLVGLTRRARGDVLVVSDSNVRVPPTYLVSMLAHLLRPGVGLVSSLVVGSGERSLGAAVENLQLAAFVAPSVLASRIVGRTITVGKSMAMRRVDLDRVGGWSSVGSVLAEDDVLGRRFHEHGYGVELCTDGIENRNVSCSLTRSFERHARWAKMRRAICPTFFALEPVLSPLCVATVVLCATGSALAMRACLAAFALQVLGSALDTRALRGRWPSWRIALIEPLRCALWLGCWMAACLNRRVEWRGNRFRLAAGSQLVPLKGERAEALEPARG